MSSRNTGKIRALHELARLYGVQVAYRDILVRRRRQASPEALLAVLRALGAPVCKLEDVRDAVRERQQALCKGCVDPVLVAWDAGPPKLTVRLAAGAARTRGVCHLQLESGETRSWITNFARLAAQVE